MSHRKVHQTLTGEDICDIIDNAAFFHCIQSKKDSFPPEQEWKLQLTRDPILPNSERDVYIRIHIEDGGGMVGKGHPYGLKKNLPQTGVGVIEELKRLANLSGREHFYRT
ncbi:MAG: hypothetical protein JJU32_16040 [Phormidium sp. BM_Day4_Bin.17]|nr:hypothetical protein [Phormidium sp. BM_Day4_Bin.17]UCJ10658.1 MAG: hypothetical protein JWS08_12485 [Phormidium sp. PBR-2020]